jgi:conjugal transfer pilus assembly protein TraE
MLFQRYVSERDNARTEITFLRLLAAGLVLGVVAEAGIAWRLAGSERTVLVPPQIQRGFWVSDNAVSREYLEQMAYWYAGLALNVTPQVSAYQNELFLKFAAPGDLGRLRAEMGARAEFLQKNSVATQFSVRGVTADERGLRVALSGTLVTWAGDKKAGERNATYLVGFKFINGRLHVSDFKETSDQDPFGNAAAGQS